jgi:hypothetical protein
VTEIHIAGGTASYGRHGSCSLRSDRAIVLGQARSGSPTVSVVDLSTGKATQLAVTLDSPPAAAMSLDSRYLAVRELPQGQTELYSTDVVDLSNGRVVASQLPGVPVGFSWDGRLLVLTSGDLPGVGPSSVLDWRARRAVWSDRSGSISDAQALPGAEDLALTVVGSEAVQVVVVGDHGRTRTIAPGAELAVLHSLPPGVQGRG